MPIVMKSRNEFWKDEASFATTLVAGLLNEFGTEALSWAPPSILTIVNEELNVTIPERNFDKLMVGVALLTTDVFYKSLPDFITMCNVMSGSSVVVDSFDPADLMECAWGITEAFMLATPDDDDENPFDDQIVRYIGSRLDYEGILQAPGVLKLGLRNNDPISEVRYTFSDDPLMFQSIWESSQESSAYLDAAVRERTMTLLQQLAKLPLEDAEMAENLQERANSVLAATSQPRS